MRFKAAMVAETAIVMAVVLFTIMFLLGEAFYIRAETEGKLSAHLEAIKSAHEVANKNVSDITKEASGTRWSISVTVPVYRPEDSLRLWSLAEQQK